MSKVEGFRKAGITIFTVGALVGKPPADFRVTLIVGVVAIVGIIAMSVVTIYKAKKEK